jgi:hypothetical protein
MGGSLGTARDDCFLLFSPYNDGFEIRYAHLQLREVDLSDPGPRFVKLTELDVCQLQHARLAGSEDLPTLELHRT